MEAIVLDTNFIQIGIVDVFRSFIWTDRYSECGDFEIYTKADLDMLDLLQPDYYLQMTGTEHTMIIAQQLIETNIEDGNHFRFLGKSLEYILKRRYIYPQTSYSGSLQNAIYSMLNSCIINPSDPKRKISNFIFEPSTDSRILSLTIDAQYTGEDLYHVISTLCNKNHIGFKIILNNQNQFVFSLYCGENRSYTQSSNPFVVFSPEFENIIDSNYLFSKENYANVTLVAGEGQDPNRKTVLVGDNESSGLNRWELFTDARDLSSQQSSRTLSDAEYEALLRQRGNEKLEEVKIAQTYEGEVETSKLFVYGKDFYLGDLVQVANAYQMEYPARITEIVFSHDEDGYSVFPSFEIIDEEEAII